jgi:beta-lactamase regulating signal transducer with metallopeptidase domain
MTIDAASALSALWFSYLLRSGTSYLLVWILSRFVRNPHFRFRLWALFLGGMIAAWLGTFLLPIVTASSERDTIALPPASGAHGSWSLSLVLAPRIGAILPTVCWAYLAILALFLLHFCARFWQLNTLLRSSRPTPPELSRLFESVRSGIQAPKCELRLVRQLRSPAATGWFSPKILLSDELLSRLEDQQLEDIFRHELMHVRRQDYLWDRLATLGCYLVFFHPAVWFARNCLRWEREFVCDEGAVGRSDQRRLEYAVCLTTLANWRVSGEEFAGSIDFLSSPSLLATRVRALVLPMAEDFSAGKNAALALVTATVLTLAVRLVPNVTVIPFSAAATEARNSEIVQESTQESPPALKAETKLVLQRNKLPGRRTFAPDTHSRLVLSKPKFRARLSAAQAPVQLRTQTTSKPSRALWRFIPRAGGWAVRSVKVGLSTVGSHLVGFRHEKEPS